MQAGRDLAAFYGLAPSPREDDDALRPSAAAGDELGDGGGQDDSGALTDALARCYAHLARREHSVAELRLRLERARIDPETVAAALAIVIEQGYLDDARYARLLAEDRRTIDGWGVERIRARLQSAGVERELIDATLAPFDAASEFDAALALLRRRVPKAPRSDPERQRAFGVLIRQGYDSDTVYEAIRRYEAEADAEAE